MAILMRGGAYADYDPTKLRPREYGVVQSGDPNTTSGAAVYLAFRAGVVKRIITAEELDAAISELVVSWDDITDKPTPDTTLTESGNAADAAATGAAITNVATCLAAAYNTSTRYAVGDFCVYNRALYQCNTAITSGETWTAGHWTAVKVMPVTKQMISDAVTAKEISFSDANSDGHIVITKGGA